MKSENIVIFALCIGSLPVRGAWVEMGELKQHGVADTSLPVRGAWVEIFRAGCAFLCLRVAPRAGSVG